MLHKFLRSGLWLAPALILLQSVSASDIPQYSFNELTDNSEVVASGQITRTWAAWDSEHKYIWTHYKLAVSAIHKGSAGTTLDIAEPGGSLDGAVLAVSGAAGYSVGDKVLVFLSRMPNGYLRTAGFGQGKYAVDAGGRIHGAVRLKAAEAATMSRSSAPQSEIRSLDGMNVSQVSQLVGARVRSIGGGVR